MTYNFDETIDRKNTNSVKYDFVEKYFGTNDISPMWVADMDFRTPDFIINALKKRLDHPILGYSYFSDEFHQSIIDWLAYKHNWKTKKEWITFSPGVVPGFSLLIQCMTEPGDKIIIQPPVYHPFFSSITDNNRQILENPLKLEGDVFKMDFENLEGHLKNGAKMLLLSNPHNPVGRAWTKSELKEMGDLCVKYNVPIVSDEIHSDLIFDGFTHTPLASISDEIADITITNMAPSKTFNLAGLSTSFLVITNKALLEKYNAALNRIHIWYGNIFGTIALQAAYQHGAEWLVQMMNYVSENIKFLNLYLNSNIPLIKAIVPEATYLVWLDCSSLKMNDEELKSFFINRAKIGMNTGISFGTGGSGYMRMNVACPRSVLAQSLIQVEKAVKLT